PSVPTVRQGREAVGRLGLVPRVRGAQGGYCLGASASDISIAQVIDALEEQPFGLTECTAAPGSCDFETGCTLRGNWHRINAAVRRTLEDVSVADMARPQPMPASRSDGLHTMVRRQPI